MKNMLDSVLEFAAKTGIVAGCGLVNMAINTAGGKLVDSKMVAALPTRTPEMTDQAYAELCEKAQKKNDLRKNITKGVIGTVSLLGTSVGASFALGAVDGTLGTAEELEIDPDVAAIED